MSWVNDCVDLSLALAKWAKQRYQSSEWKKKLEAVSRELLLEDVDLRTAEETVRLAHEAGFTGEELLTVEERIAAIKAYEGKKAKPARGVATKMRKKKPTVKKKPSGKAKKAKASAKKRSRKSATGKRRTSRR